MKRSCPTYFSALAIIAGLFWLVSPAAAQDRPLRPVPPAQHAEQGANDGRGGPSPEQVEASVQEQLARSRDVSQNGKAVAKKLGYTPV